MGNKNIKDWILNNENNMIRTCRCHDCKEHNLKLKNINTALNELLELRLLKDQVLDIRELIFDDADHSAQGGMMGSPAEVLHFAKEWIKNKRLK